MKLLAIDCSTDKAEVALSFEGKLTAITKEGVREHSRCLLPMVADLLKEVKCSVSELDGLVFGRGPGSFTGLRVACSVVKGLALAHDLPIYPVSGLSAIAHHYRFDHPTDKPIIALIDARMNELYWATYAKDEDFSEEHLSTLTDITWPSEAFVMAGVGFEAYLSEADFKWPTPYQKIKLFPSAMAMLRLALSGKIAPLTAEGVLPVYIRNQVIQGSPRG